MAKEERELLLIDLCGRLSHDIKVDCSGHIYYLNDVNVGNKVIDFISVLIQDEKRLHNPIQTLIDNIKPYLRPMSSMTEEEKLYLKLNYGFELHGDVLSNLHIIKGGGYYEREGEYIEPTEDRQYTHITIDTVSELIKWLNAHHFDYRGLIPLGLAIEAQEGMYNNKIEE